MRKNIKEDSLNKPINQLQLFGYEDYFNSFKKLFEKDMMPNSILISGQKGIGKSTFIYHFINYLLSQNEKNEYLLSNFSINPDSSTYKLMIANTHPNFFIIKNEDTNKSIKIEQIRLLNQFLNKTSYKKNLKIVMIDDAELLNLNSANALLKTLEEPTKNTFFFLIQNSNFKILDTIKSRCTEFKFSFKISEKTSIFKKIINLYSDIKDTDELINYLKFDTPGNIIKYSFILQKKNLTLTKDKMKTIFLFIDEYKLKKDLELLNFIKIFIEKFYNELCLKNLNNFNMYFFNLNSILKKINDMKKYNLDEKNTFLWIENILINET